MNNSNFCAECMRAPCACTAVDREGSAEALARGIDIAIARYLKGGYTSASCVCELIVGCSETLRMAAVDSPLIYRCGLAGGIVLQFGGARPSDGGAAYAVLVGVAAVRGFPCIDDDDRSWFKGGLGSDSPTSSGWSRHLVSGAAT